MSLAALIPILLVAGAVALVMVRPSEAEASPRHTWGREMLVIVVAITAIFWSVLVVLLDLS